MTRFNFRDPKLREIIPLETLFIINKANELKKDNPYVYRNGETMSHRDVIRLEIMRLHGLDKPLGIRGATERLKDAIENRWLKVSGESYRGVTAPKRLLYELTKRGSDKLTEGWSKPQETHGDKLSLLGQITNEERINWLSEEEGMVIT